MTIRSFFAIFRKEFRQQHLLCVTLSIFCVAVQMFIMIGAMLNERAHVEASVYPFIAGLFLMIYHVASISIIFCNEHEENTYPFIRVLPITRGSILFGKLAWVFVSTLCMAVALCIATWLFQMTVTEMSYHNTNDIHIATLFYIVVLIAGFFWGLFWTTRLKNQMLSFLLAGICTVFQIMLTSMLVANMSPPPTPDSVSMALWGTLYFLVTFPVALIGLWGGWNWIAKKENAPSFRAIEPQTRYEQLRELAAPPRGEFRWLLWQTFRQSRPMLVFALVFGLITFIIGGLTLLYSDSPGDLFQRPHLGRLLFMFYSGWYMLLALVPFALCGSVFWKDQRRGAYQVLCNRGISPRKVWWSRILVFGTTYFWAPFMLVILTVLYGVWIGITHIDGTHPWAYHIQDIIGNQREMIAVKVYLLSFFTVFCIGQYFSILSRSFVIPIFGAAFFSVVLTAWAGLMQAELNLSLIWTAYPILIACLVCSRLRAPDWLRGRNSWQAHLKAFSPLLVVVLVILLFIPIVRVYSVRPLPNTFDNPTHGLSISSWSNRGWDFKNVDGEIEEIYENIRTADGDIAKLQSSWLAIQDLLKNRKNATHFHQTSMLENTIYYDIEKEINKDAVSKETLQAAVSFLEMIPERRASLVDVATRLHTAVEMDLRNGVVVDLVARNIEITDWQFKKPQEHDVPRVYPIVFPWEKYRAKRLLDRAFQIQTPFLAQLENTISSSVSTNLALSAEVMNRLYGNSLHHYPTVSYYERTYCNIAMRASFESMHEITYAEQQRRALLLQAALHLYWLEHETLPGTLQELKESEILKAIPKAISATHFTLTFLPEHRIISGDFGYVPFPEEITPEQLEPGEMDVVELFSEDEWRRTIDATYGMMDDSMMSSSGSMMGGMGIGGMEPMGGFAKPPEIPRSKTPFLYEHVDDLRFHPLMFAAPKE